jgi:triosephosphate isomerase
MRKPFIAGNWKMNTNAHTSYTLARSIAAAADGIAGEQVSVAVCPPFVYLQQVAQALGASDIAVGAQDVYFESDGAFTGEISCAMLKDIGCAYVIIGHSERRHVTGETDELINKKLQAAVNSGLLPILCVGELLSQRKAGQTESVVTAQIKQDLAGLCRERLAAVTIAYEPVWAIGTGVNATPQQAQEAHQMIRSLIAELYDGSAAEQLRIQYGGSAKPGNAAELMAQPDVDGLLVGGASLKADDFVAIIKAAL